MDSIRGKRAGNKIEREISQKGRAWPEEGSRASGGESSLLKDRAEVVAQDGH